MTDFLFLLGLLLALGVVALLGFLSKRYPWFGLVAGSGVIATAVYFWQRTSMRDFRSDGSAAGAVMMLVFGFFELLLLGIGVSLIATAIASWRSGGSDDSPASASATAQAADTPAKSPSGDASAPTEDAPTEKPSRKVAWFALLVGFVIAIPAVRLMLGLSNDLICGRKGCIDFFGFLAWVKSWGGPFMLGLCYLALAGLFFGVAWSGLFAQAPAQPGPVAQARPKAWLDKYRKPPRTPPAV